MTAPQSTLKIKKIVTHQEPHFDEFVAIDLARRYGRQEWPSIRNATIVTKDGSVKIYGGKSDWLVIGIAEGEFDEHGNGKDLELCSADLIAKHLGIEKDYKVSFLLNKVRVNDRKGKSTPLDLGQCIRMLNHLGWSPARIEAWLKVFLDCYFDDHLVIKNKSFETPVGHFEFPITNPETRALITENILLNQWLTKAKKGIKKAILEQGLTLLRRDLSLLSKRESSRMFDLIECASLIATFHPNDPKIVSNWVEPIFRACLKFQNDFLKACEIVKGKKALVIEPKPNCDVWDRIQILGIDRHSNRNGNRRLASAAKMLNSNLDILVIQQQSGNVQIMVVRNHRYHLIPMIARAIRLEEMIVDCFVIDKTDTYYDHIGTPGRIDETDLWYMPVNDNGQGFALFNGSLTVPNIAPTMILFDRILDIVANMVIRDDTPNSWYQYANRRLAKHRNEINKQSTTW